MVRTVYRVPAFVRALSNCRDCSNCLPKLHKRECWYQFQITMNSGWRELVSHPHKCAIPDCIMIQLRGHWIISRWLSKVVRGGLHRTPTPSTAPPSLYVCKWSRMMSKASVIGSFVFTKFNFKHSSDPHQIETTSHGKPVLIRLSQTYVNPVAWIFDSVAYAKLAMLFLLDSW